jgi:septal ring factor EnvC (AmiA/AmiB activator)
VLLQKLEEELALKSNEVVAMSEDLVNVTAENQSINAELIDVVSSRDQAREQMGAMELRMGHAESGVMMKETEYKELLASYRYVNQIHLCRYLSYSSCL